VPISVIRGSRHRSLAVLVDTSQGEPPRALECTLDPAPACTDIPFLAHAPHRPVVVVYRGARPVFFQSNGELLAWSRGALHRLGTVERMTGGMHATGDETVLVGGSDGKLHWINELGKGSLVLPQVPRNLRVAARPDTTRIAVIAESTVLVYDLRTVIPRRFAMAGKTALFIDDDTLLLVEPHDLAWLDLPTGAITPIATQATLPVVLDIDDASGRVLIAYVHPRGMTIELLRRGSGTGEIVVATEPPRQPWARLVRPDAVIFGIDDGKVHGKVGGEPAKQVATIDGSVRHSVALGDHRYAVHGSTGEVLRGDLRTGAIDRTRVAMGGGALLASDERGRVLLVGDNRVLVWDGQVSEIARFDKSIQRIERVAGGIAVFLADNETYVVRLPVAGPPHRVLAGSPVPPAISADGTLLVALGTSRTTGIVELPSLARWSLPAIDAHVPSVHVSPTTRRVLQHVGSGFVVWQLPHVDSDLAGWLDTQSNATLDSDNVLAWPWQVARGP
jgi:hypothetical protein